MSFVPEIQASLRATFVRSFLAISAQRIGTTVVEIFREFAPVYSSYVLPVSMCDHRLFVHLRRLP
jgi:hypothetical protein